MITMLDTLLGLGNLAANIAQSAALANNARQLEALQSQAASSELYRKVLDSIREFVFKSNEQIETLKNYTETAPEAVYVSAGVISWKFNQIGISPSIFPEFGDKEYVRAVEKKLADLTSAANSRMEHAKLDEANLAIEAMTQSRQLAAALSAQPVLDQLALTEEEWELLEVERKMHGSNATTFGVVGLIVVLVGLPILFAMSLGMIFSNSAAAQSLAMLLCLVQVGLPFAALIIWVTMRDRGRTKHWAELKTQRENLRKGLPEQAVIDEYKRDLGDLTSEGYQAMAARREQLISRVFAKGGGKILPPSVFQM